MDEQVSSVMRAIRYLDDEQLINLANTINDVLSERVIDPTAKVIWDRCEVLINEDRRIKAIKEYRDHHKEVCGRVTDLNETKALIDYYALLLGCPGPFIQEQRRLGQFPSSRVKNDFKDMLLRARQRRGDQRELIDRHAVKLERQLKEAGLL